MYRNQNTTNKRWIDPARKAELMERDRIRQAHYAKLEREKQGLLNLEAPEESEEVQDAATEQPEDPTPAELQPEPKYFTQLAKKGWYNVIGPAGVPVNATLLRLEVAEKKATRMNNGANR